ncbi:MAG: MFS transporter [Kiritimatiellae bacterium]|nr:MFS transporter [Kiritimatiellia bacterium]
MSGFRWIICSLLFFATTVNYLDRQVLSLTYKDFIAPVFGWSDDDYGTITAVFSIVYAICNLFAGKFIDRLGTKKGYLWAIFVWSLGACLHAACGAGTSALKAVGFLGMMGVTTSVWLFLACRAVLALGEAGNFPAAIKVTAEYFPKKDRAFATSIFNSGSSVGALAAPLSIPLIAKHCGWEMSFVIIGALGFVWMGFWMWLYRRPAENPRVNAAELAYIDQDDADDEAARAAAEGPRISFLKAFSLRQTWSLVLGRFFTDGVWWFFLFWTPSYLSEQFGYKSSDGMGMALIFTLYAIVTFVSIYLCRLPTYMVDRRGMNPYEGRMVAMLLFACLPLFALGAQPLGAHSAWWPAVLIGLACAGHQAWSANIYSVVGDMFPKSTIGTLTGIAQFAAGCGSFLVNKCAGKLFTYAAGTTVVDGREVEMTKDLLASGAKFARPAMEFLGYTGKPAGYCIVFGYCAVAYLVGWCFMKALVPKYRKVELQGSGE